MNYNLPPKIYYRKSLFDKEEFNAANDYFECVNLISDIKKNDYIIPRYSLYPFPLDQEKEFKNIGAKAINSYEQHLYVADMINYVSDLGELTPLTWDNLYNLPEDCSFVLKGETNSKKSNWNLNMFAIDKRAASEVYSRLCDDGLISQQKIYIRKYEPLVTYMIGIGGVPITKEFRFFVALGEILCGDYYWANYVDDLESKPNVNEVPKEFLQKVIDIVSPNINFFVIDVAQKQNGEWMVVELNSGEQSGLSCNDPNKLYENLRNVLDKKIF